jgi:hypothetical protein
VEVEPAPLVVHDALGQAGGAGGGVEQEQIVRCQAAPGEGGARVVPGLGQGRSVDEQRLALGDAGGDGEVVAQGQAVAAQ